jgi:DNA-binding transcriptional LysR family regulator
MRPPFDIDLRHLKIFVLLHEHRSVSRVAEVLAAAQPSISIALSRLREHYGDPLFVRSGQTMQPTARASMLIGPIHDALRLLDHAEEEVPVFAPERAERRFKLAIADGGKPVVLPALARFLAETAPHVSLDIRDIGGDTPEQLEAGDIDLAFGFMRLRKQGLFHQGLFSERFSCLVRNDHPVVRTRLTLQMLETVSLVQVSGTGNSFPLLASLLGRARITPRVAMLMPDALGLAEVVTETQHIALIPERMARTLAADRPLVVLPIPIKMEPYTVSQHWHRRNHHDAGHRWFRQCIAELFSDRPKASSRKS